MKNYYKNNIKHVIGREKIAVRCWLNFKQNSRDGSFIIVTKIDDNFQELFMFCWSRKNLQIFSRNFPPLAYNTHHTFGNIFTIKLFNCPNKQKIWNHRQKVLIIAFLLFHHNLFFSRMELQKSWPSFLSVPNRQTNEWWIIDGV